MMAPCGLWPRRRLVACGHDSATLPLCAQLRRANSAQMREKVTMNENAEITEIFFPEVVRLTMFRHSAKNLLSKQCFQQKLFNKFGDKIISNSDSPKEKS